MRHPIRIAITTLALGLATALSSTARADDLMDIYQLARQSDPQLQAADAQRLATSEGVVQSRAALLPQISGNAQYGDSSTAGYSGAPRPFTRPDGTLGYGPTSSTGDGNSRSYSVTLNQTIYDHRNYTRLKAARALRSRGEADYETALDGLFIRVATAYFNALTAKTNLAAADAEEKAVKRQLEQAEQRFEVGLTAITDVHEARARYDSARASVILARNQLDDAFEALNELTGQPVETVESLNTDIPLDLPDPADPEAWVTTALDQSPSLASRRFALAAAEHDVSTARAGHYPTLSAQVSRTNSDNWGSGEANGVVIPSRSGNFDTSIGVQLNVPIFEGLGTQSRVRQSIHTRDATADQLEVERRAVVRTTRNAYRAVEAGKSEVDARKQALVSAQSALDATQAGFEVGTRTIVDVLLSQQQLFAAQREYARARHDFILSGLRLKQSAGVIDVADLQHVNEVLSAGEPATETPASNESGG